jgi:hypothetical protein
MRILVLSCAEDEFAEAVDYYNKQRLGLGFEFAAEVQRTFERIRRYPEAWMVFSCRASEMHHQPIPLRCAIPSS